MNLLAELLPLFDKWVQDHGHRFIYRVGTYWIVGLSNPEDIEVGEYFWQCSIVLQCIMYHINLFWQKCTCDFNRIITSLHFSKASLPS